MKKIPANMRYVLKKIADGYPSDFGCNTQAHHGGRTQTLRALVRAGLLNDDYTVSKEGREYLRDRELLDGKTP